MSITATKTQKTKPKQQFIRLNLDEDLEELLREYEVKYKLLNRSDIIRMLLSEIYWQNKMANRQQLASFLTSLPKPETSFTEDEMFAELEKSGLM